MSGSIRSTVAVIYAACATAVLVPLQMVSMKTGWWPESFILKRWHRSILRALGLRVSMRGEMVKGRPLLIAANHVSWTDIMALGSLVDVSFIAKSDMADWPLVGNLSRLQRTVFIERERKRASGDQAGEIGRRMAAGDAMVLFPEGTTADGNLLLPFKSTLFGAASVAVAEGAASSVFIQPVALAYTKLHGVPMGRQHRRFASWIGDMALGPHVRQLIAQGGMDVVISFGEPLEFKAGSSRKEVARIMEERVRAMLMQSLYGQEPDAPGSR